MYGLSFKEAALFILIALPVGSLLTACDSGLGADIAGAEAANQQNGSTTATTSQMSFYAHCVAQQNNSGSYDAVGTTGYNSLNTDGQNTTVGGFAQINSNVNQCTSGWFSAEVVPQIVSNSLQSLTVQGTSSALQFGLSGYAGEGSSIYSSGQWDRSLAVTCQVVSAYASRVLCPTTSTTYVSCPNLQFYVCSN